MAATGIPTEILLVPDRFAGRFGAPEVAAALAQGLAAVGLVSSTAHLDEADYNVRMRAARAVITAVGELDRHGLVGTVVSEVATRARQAGVPCHAVVGRNSLERFDTRILDLQFVLEAMTIGEIEAAGAQIGELIRSENDRGR